MKKKKYREKNDEWKEEEWDRGNEGADKKNYDVEAKEGHGGETMDTVADGQRRRLLINWA
jgi:hypothetical protein